MRVGVGMRPKNRRKTSQFTALFYCLRLDLYDPSIAKEDAYLMA